eukprot:TRINITY_DN18093_c0_g1_i2.p1 TRINITY_DN18093_c0_g1~~TRINITY_DN18093_c0_g1_i2.p1  ORF type:complete len:638 (+),score=132.14 TRINITY_DN18093_c0_g1_i2:64-1914(+)
MYPLGRLTAAKADKIIKQRDRFDERRRSVSMTPRSGGSGGSTARRSEDSEASPRDWRQASPRDDPRYPRTGDVGTDAQHGRHALGYGVRSGEDLKARITGFGSDGQAAPEDDSWGFWGDIGVGEFFGMESADGMLESFVETALQTMEAVFIPPDEQPLPTGRADAQASLRPSLNPADWERADDRPGSYRICPVPADVLVTDTKELGGARIADLPCGAVVEVVEMVCLQNRLRARITQPAGWVSVLNTSTGFRWLERLEEVEKTCCSLQELGVACAAEDEEEEQEAMRLREIQARKQQAGLRQGSYEVAPAELAGAAQPAAQPADDREVRAAAKQSDLLEKLWADDGSCSERTTVPSQGERQPSGQDGDVDLLGFKEEKFVATWEEGGRCHQGGDASAAARESPLDAKASDKVDDELWQDFTAASTTSIRQAILPSSPQGATSSSRASASLGLAEAAKGLSTPGSATTRVHAAEDAQRRLDEQGEGKPAEMNAPTSAPDAKAAGEADDDCWADFASAGTTCGGREITASSSEGATPSSSSSATVPESAEAKNRAGSDLISAMLHVPEDDVLEDDLLSFEMLDGFLDEPLPASSKPFQFTPAPRGVSVFDPFNKKNIL